MIPRPVVALFCLIVPFRSIDDPTKLRRVLEATLLIEADLELPALLRHVVEEARSMIGARYGALGVLNDDGTALTEFITVGLDPEQEKLIGPRPTGRGVLGLLIADPRPLRLGHLSDHAESYGFPANHPPMTSFLGVPIKVRDEVYGNLYLTDKVGWSEFTLDDVALVEALGLAAGIAIENTRLHQQVRVAAVYEDRDRMARDLHDTVIQRLFGVGLTLQSMAARGSGDMAKGLEAAVAEIDHVIQQVRSTIYELGMNGENRGIRDSVITLVRELDTVVGFEVQVSLDGPVDASISDQVAEHLLATIRESVTNIGRHAKATEASVNLAVEGDQCRLTISDNGTGFDPSKPGDGGLGLTNLRRRAEKLNGTFAIEEAEGGGTSLVWQVPTGP
jgi:signal transduction histidine kinase